MNRIYLGERKMILLKEVLVIFINPSADMTYMSLLKKRQLTYYISLPKITVFMTEQDGKAAFIAGIRNNRAENRKLRAAIRKHYILIQLHYLLCHGRKLLKNTVFIAAAGNEQGIRRNPREKISSLAR